MYTVQYVAVHAVEMAKEMKMKRNEMKLLYSVQCTWMQSAEWNEMELHDCSEVGAIKWMEWSEWNEIN